MVNRGYYGEFGGDYLPEVLTSTFKQRVISSQNAKNDPAFWQEFM